MMSGHPNAFISLISNNCDIDFVTIEEDKIDKLIAYNSAFHKVVLHKGLYPGITEDQNTVAAPVILVTTEKTDKKIVQNFSSYFDRNIDKFKESHPVLYDISSEHFLSKTILPSYDFGSESGVNKK